jgi:hypothetical protein
MGEAKMGSGEPARWFGCLWLYLRAAALLPRGSEAQQEAGFRDVG